MSKAIKVDNRVYHQLDALRGKGETFSDVVDKLVTIKVAVDTLLGIWHNQYGEREQQTK